MQPQPCSTKVDWAPGSMKSPHVAMQSHGTSQHLWIHCKQNQSDSSGSPLECAAVVQVGRAWFGSCDQSPVECRPAVLSLFHLQSLMTNILYLGTFLEKWLRHGRRYVGGQGAKWPVGIEMYLKLYTNVKMDYDDRDHWSSGLSRRSYT